MYTPQLLKELKGYSKEKAFSDIFAGFTVGIIALPLAMAFAIASGLPPERGIFTAIVAGFLISALGGSKVQIGGPTGAFVVIVSSIVVKFGYPGLAACTIIAGLFLILFGMFRFGGLIKFIPFPVITGFTTGIAVLIFSTQIKDLLGLRIEHVPASFLAKWYTYVTSVTTINYQAALIGIMTIALIALAKYCYPKLPAMLLGMLIATLICYLFKWDVETIGSRFGDLPRSLPAPSIPGLPAQQLGELIKAAFTIALLAAIESLLSATVADGMINSRHNPNIELIGQGIANMVSAVFGGIPATGAIARTATNIKSGGKTPVAGLIHAIVLTLLLLLFAPFAKLIPLASLAGILVVVSYNMSELHHFKSLLKGPKSDSFVLILTFLLTVLIDLTVAVQVGVILAALLFIRRMAEIANVEVITCDVKGDYDKAESNNESVQRHVPADVEVFEVNGPFFFGMIDSFKNALNFIEKTPRVLIIRIRNVPVVDATAIHVLQEFYYQCKKDSTVLIFSGVTEQPLNAFRKSGFIEDVGIDNFLPDIDSALNRATMLLK